MGIFEITGALALIGLVVYVWKTLPPEHQDIIEAREKYGKVPK